MTNDFPYNPQVGATSVQILWWDELANVIALTAFLLLCNVPRHSGTECKPTVVQAAGDIELGGQTS